MSTQTTTAMITFTIDGQQVTVPKGTTVYTAAKNLGIDLPIFCYQDRMPPFGACRACLVEVEKMPKPQTSCTLEATEGMVVRTQSALAVESRKDILEFLLINHPLDCPICDKGGECPLQDQTLEFGPGQSRFYEEKRHFKKPLPLGPVLMLDRERCVVCARCTRFSDIVSGDHALQFIERGFRTEVGTPHGGPVESKFIGNTIAICPVGALTSQVYRFRARPWDNQSNNSTCTLCPVGCGLIFDSRDGELLRTRAQENRALNDIWLCDKGWFGYEFSNHKERLEKPLVKKNGAFVETSWEEALDLIAKKFEASVGSGKIAGFGGNPLTVEDNYLFQKLIRDTAKVNNLDHRIGLPIFEPEEEGVQPGMEMEIGECEELSYAFLLGVDITEEYPVLWLRLRQAINKGAKVIFLGHYAPEVANQLSSFILHAPGDELAAIKSHTSEISAYIQDNKKGAIFIGRQYLNQVNRAAILAEVSQICRQTGGPSLNVLDASENSMGARFAGMLPYLGPLGEKIEQPGLNALQVLEKAGSEGWQFLYAAGCNPALKYPSSLWNKARSNLGFLVVQDVFFTATAQQADVFLPTLSFVEKSGSFINIEGRVQTLSPGKAIPNNLLSDGEIFTNIAYRLNKQLSTDPNFHNNLAAGSRKLLPNLSFSKPPKPQVVERNGKLSAVFAPSLFDHGVRMQHNTHLIKLAKEPKVRLHPNDAMKRGIHTGDEVEIQSDEGKIKALIKIDARVAEGTLVLPLGFSDLIPVHELGKNLLNGLPLTISKR